MSTSVVHCGCRWLIATACTAAAFGCAGPVSQTPGLLRAAPEDSPAPRVRFSLPAGATLVDLGHESRAEATSWIDIDLRAAPAPLRNGGGELGFVAVEGTAGPRGFGADRDTTAADDDAPGAVVRRPRHHRLVAPLAVIDMCSRAARDHDAELGVEEIDAYERELGPIEAGTAILVRTCWYWRWANRDRYLGTSRIGPRRFHFPGISWQAAKALIEREVSAVAIDTAGVDHGPSTGEVVRRTLERAKITVFVNVVAYQDLPARGALLMVLPMRIPGSDQSPTRILALSP